jgi:serine/threonine-protein kinase
MSHLPSTELPGTDRPVHAETPVQVGDVLAGKYRVERVLGVGGMGVVVAATNLMLDQLVALKFMLAHALANKDAVMRFVREARSAVKLRSEHVGRVLDVGTLDNGAPYIVMEYLDGSDLSGISTARGALPVSEATGYVLQAIDAIAEAHSLGIVHRDLKPANLFVARRNDGSPLVKVLDFGISKAKLSIENLTATSALMGSPGYMSPEQMRASRDVDPRTDIWSIGVILYELVSGALPFSADTMPELCVKILQDPVRPLREVAPTVPRAFEAVVERCMEKDRTRRYANVAELALALAPFAPAREQGTAERVAAVLRVTIAETPAPAPAGTGARPFASSTVGDAVGQVVDPPVARRPRTALIAGAVGALGVGALALAFALGRGDTGGAIEPTPGASRILGNSATQPPPVVPPAPVAPAPVAPAPVAPAAIVPAPPVAVTPAPAPAPSSPPPAAHAQRDPRPPPPSSTPSVKPSPKKPARTQPSPRPVDVKPTDAVKPAPAKVDPPKPDPPKPPPPPPPAEPVDPLDRRR